MSQDPLKSDITMWFIIPQVRVWEIDQDMSTANDTIVLVEHKLEAYVTNLTPGKSYNLRVLAYSNGGDGRMSSPAITFQMGDYHTDAYSYSARSSAQNLHVQTVVLLTSILLFLSLKWVISWWQLYSYVGS